MLPLGPQDELEYWKKRGARFSQIVNQVNSDEVQLTILCLKLSHSKIIKDWKETDKKITFCYNEAKDNAKFIQALETKCHSLYLDDPVSSFSNNVNNNLHNTDKSVSGKNEEVTSGFVADGQADSQCLTVL